MEHTNTTALILTIILLGGFVFGILLIAYDDGIPFGMYRKLMCKMNKHRYQVRFGFRRVKVNKYYCATCKKARSHPKLEIIEGGAKKIGDISYKL